MSVAGFFSFYARPFQSTLGIMLLIGLGVYIYLRTTGRIDFELPRLGKNKGKGRKPDHII